jgi:hypothetical protein
MKSGRVLAVLLAAVGVSSGDEAWGEQSKVDRLLQAHGFVLAANAYPAAELSVDRVKGANYSSVLWHWESNLPQLGPAPGAIPWGRWAGEPDQMPPVGGEAAYMGNMLMLQLSDEPALEIPATFDKLATWTRAAKADPRYANTLIMADLLGISDPTMARFIAEAKPDLLMNDLYPWKSVYVAASGSTPEGAGAPIGGAPTNWYAEMRRLRAHTVGSGTTQFGMYRQTFHALQSWDATAYRDPTPSELGLSTFAPMAFNAKALADFVFNGGASSFFNGGSMASPRPLYDRLAEVNRAAGAFGRTLVRLAPLNDTHDGGVETTDVLFVRGQHKDGNGVTQYNPVPGGFRANGGNANSFITQWTAYSTAVAQGNPGAAMDPWLTGFQAKNLGTTNDGLKGDAIISWFKPVGMTKAEARTGRDIYYMVVNGLTSADAGSTEADCLQYINLDFTGAPVNSIQYMDPLTGDVKVLSHTTAAVPATAPGGTYMLTTASGKLRLSLFLDGGDAFLFKFNTGSPFVVPEPASAGVIGGAGAAVMMGRRRR